MMMLMTRVMTVVVVIRIMLMTTAMMTGFRVKMEL